MTVETLGDALAAGWKAQARCMGRARDKPKSSRPCPFSINVDMLTLAMAKGPSFPIAMLQQRIMCPRCGGRDVMILYFPPTSEARHARL